MAWATRLLERAASTIIAMAAHPDLWLVLGRGFPDGAQWSSAGVFSSQGAAVEDARRQARARPVVCQVFRERVDDRAARRLVYSVESWSRWGTAEPNLLREDWLPGGEPAAPAAGGPAQN